MTGGEPGSIINLMPKLKYAATLLLVISSFLIGYFLKDKLIFKSAPRAEIPTVTNVATKGAVVKTPEPKEGTYRVTKIIDGDTIEIETGQRVRYLGINAPEMQETWGEEAKRQNDRLVFHKNVRLELDRIKTDKYGRILAYVWVAGVMVNEQLLKDGYAKLNVYSDEPRLKYLERFRAAQAQAKEHRDGLWYYGWNKSVPVYW